MIEIGNDGKDIAYTNYWQSELAKKGFLYLSWNAGAGRLLIPDTMHHLISEMKTADEVIISSGYWTSKNRDALELLFEDNTEAPFVINIVTQQTDRLLPDADQGGGFVIAVWTESGKKMELPAKYRSVGILPCLQKWVDQ